MRAAVLSPDGSRALRAQGSAPAADARRLGRDLAARTAAPRGLRFHQQSDRPDEQRE